MLFSCGKPKFTAGGEYQCHLCEYSTFDKGYLQQHQRCHTGERPFSCDKCEYRSVQNGDLKRHKLTHQPRNICLVRNVIVDMVQNHLSPFT